MENASKALIIAGEVLIGVIILTLMVFMFRAMGSFSDAVNSNIDIKNLSEFNVKFEQYNKDNLTVQDIVTMGNLAREYNNQMESIQIQVIVYGVESKYQNAHTLDDKTDYEFIQKYSNKNSSTKGIQYFNCQNMHYNERTGRINRIEIKKIE